MEDSVRQNFISANKTTAICSFGQVYKVGEAIGHDDPSIEDTAIIESFSIDEESEEVLVHTDKGSAHLDFCVKVDIAETSPMTDEEKKEFSNVESNITQMEEVLSSLKEVKRELIDAYITRISNK